MFLLRGIIFLPAYSYTDKIKTTRQPLTQGDNIMKKIKNMMIRFINYFESTLNEVIKYDPTFHFPGPGYAL